jgi:hypothetical protein
VTAGDGEVMAVDRVVWSVGIATQATFPEGAPSAPFPTDVVAALVELDPATYGWDAAWNPETVREALADIRSLLQDRAIVKPVLRYAGFLRAMSAIFDYVYDRFDPVNHLSDPSAKDYWARATSSDEMLAIANHLYVLHSRGVLDSVIECGCFKGFSTCCLSQACAWLGVDLHVFDSFAGLPPSASDYYAEGDFQGSMDEVRDNLRTFGRPSSVHLHQGFFADTLPLFDGPVGCIWMDVDLRSSSRDVMALLPRLPSESCVFSHEMPPEAFAGGRLRPEATEVLTPIIEAFEAGGRPPAGQHVTGLVGSIRAAGTGIPALGHQEISEIVAAAGH